MLSTTLANFRERSKVSSVCRFISNACSEARRLEKFILSSIFELQGRKQYVLFGETSETRSVVSHWLRKFREGNSSIKSEPR